MVAQVLAKSVTAAQTPELPHAKPDALGLSAHRLQRMSDALKRDIDRGTIPGVNIMVARRGQIGWFESHGRQSPAADTAMGCDTIFRIFSMTKPIVSTGIMMLIEDGYLLLTDPIEKFIAEFANQKVGVETGGKLELVPRVRSITIQDLLRHTSGITYGQNGTTPVHQMYQKAGLRDRSISNAEHAAIIASLPLLHQPGPIWNYSQSTDVLGRVIEVVSGKPLSAFLTERILGPLQMTETGFHTGAENKDRLAQPFPTDPWSGEKVQLYDPLEKPKMESGGGGLVSTMKDYARFCQMLLNGGKLGDVRIIGPRTLQFMASDQLGPNVKTPPQILPGHSFGLGFAVRTEVGQAPFAGSVGQFFWGGMAGTFFFIDPKEDLFALFMSQGPGQRDHFRTLTRAAIYGALED
jgi:CubicO group peptidase (beta-lactamase class C family)